MDEVDGMSGNDDRGGIAELIQLIKKTKVHNPIKLNDRYQLFASVMIATTER